MSRFDWQRNSFPAATRTERDAMAWPPAYWEPELADGPFAPPAPSGRSGAAGFTRELVQTLVLALVLSLGVQMVVQQRLVEGTSMEPTLHTGQRLLINRLSVYGVGEPQRGDIVVFHSWTDGKDYIKRVIGLPGDDVAIHDGQVFVNDARLDEPYLDQTTTDTVSAVRLEPDEYYVLGDNRGNSADSRYYGPLHKNHLIGTAFLSLWPLQTFGRLDVAGTAHARP
jgi:signal peptidase I